MPKLIIEYENCRMRWSFFAKTCQSTNCFLLCIIKDSAKKALNWKSSSMSRMTVVRALLTHGHARQLLVGPMSIGTHTNLWLCTAFYCLNTDFVESTNTINICLILSTIYIFIPVSGCVGRGPSALLCPWTYNTVNAALAVVTTCWRLVDVWWTLAYGVSPVSNERVIFAAIACQEHVSFNEMMMSSLYYTNILNWIFIVLVHWNSSTRVDMSLHSDTLSWLRANQSFQLLLKPACLTNKPQILIL